jgi:hypothetical protein
VSTTETTFPERMRAMATRNHTSAAARALDELGGQSADLKRDMLRGRRLGTAALAQLAGLVTTAAIHLSALEELRETKEWDDAEKSG